MRESGRAREWDSNTGHRAQHQRSALGNEKIRVQERGRQWKRVDTRQLIWNGKRNEHREGGFDREQWKGGNWSMHRQWGYDRGQYKQATAFFFTNMSEDWSYTEMWRTFGKFGRVFDIYSPQRRSKNGRRFGFVRFLNVRNIRELKKQLDQIKVEGHKLWVNLAKYPEEKHKGERVRRIIPSKVIVHGKSYVDAVRGQEGLGSRKSVEKTLESPLMRGEDKRKAHETQKQPKSGLVWKQKKRGKEWSGLEFKVKKEEFQWLQGSYVGVAHSVEIVPNLEEKFYMEGYFSCRLRAMGGKLVLMDGENKDEIKDLVEGAPEWLGQWFSEVKPWSPSMVEKERFVWIRCQGAPLHAWGPEFFEELALVWGKCICLDDSTSKKRSLGQINRIGSDMNTPSDSELDESWSNATDYTAGFDGDSRGEETGDNTGENISGRGTFSSKERGSRLAVTSNSEVNFEFEGKSTDEDWSKKKARLSHSILGEEESVDVVADSFEMDLEEDDIEERGDIEMCVSGSKVKTVSNSNPAARVGSYGLATHTNSDSLVGYGTKGNWAGEGESIENWVDERLNTSPLKGSEVRPDGGIKKKISQENTETKDTNTLEKCSSCNNKRGSIEGSREEEMSTTQKKDKKKKRKKRSKSCTFVYQKSILLGFMKQKKKSRGRCGARQMEEEAMPVFLPNTSNSIAGGSIGDNGAVAEEEESIIRKLEELETRDRTAKEKESLKGPSKEQKITEADKMKEEIATCFEETFIEEQCVRPSVGLQFKQIALADNDYLIAPFTEEEIKTAVWDCESSKAPGPDGFNFKFIKSEWETIRGDVTEFIHEFQKNGKIVKSLNTSFIVLVPKVENPQKIEEYRPISLIGGIYKILAKLLANRLKKVLARIVGEQQMAFLSSRQLMDGVVIANKVIDEVKKKRKEVFLFKIDFEKAYDKVSWRFLDFMMQKMGFSNSWRKWIMECLRSSMVLVLVNGSPTRQFSMSRGLRQGDPLCPFLFLIIAEGINGLVLKAVEKGLLEGVEVRGKRFKITHLQYADDTLLFGIATKENVWAMKSILRIFELVSGLKINFNKSQLIGIGVKEEWLEKMAWILCCKKGYLPFKYLGIPIGGRSGKLSFWKPVLEGVSRKLSTWKGRYLSLGGRITLINSVLSSLPVFWMSVYMIPKGKDNTVSQMGWWLNGSWIWKLQWRRRLYSWEVQEETEILKEIQETTSTKGKTDVREWIHSNNGVYITRSAYKALTLELERELLGVTLQKVWNALVPSKVSAFSWQLLQEKTPTKANLFKRGIIQNMEDCKCELCGHQLEETSHLFTQCKVAYDLWNACFRWWGIRTALDRDGCKVFQQHPSALKVAGIKEGWRCIWFVVVWTLRLARNDSIFNRKEADNCKLLELAQLRSFSWMNAERKDVFFHCPTRSRTRYPA
ncbi:hypothetical protein SLEP1_g21337 [Rubroshorea leprosula]|uniref:Reverse transcriptase domain-containing protein n=1 Tax=Rubroshorea leprosula TaxID=152421 RepID=A0AAV5JEV1_9ROSI|nr:hypothetical protein SLEP1_g21337 [Rubroshorea leprosula]